MKVTKRNVLGPIMSIYRSKTPVLESKTGVLGSKTGVSQYSEYVLFRIYGIYGI